MGYTTSGEVGKEQYVALGVTFENCAGGQIAITDLFTYAQGTPCGNDVIGGADQIWRWVTAESKWTKYYYLSVGRKEKIERWVKDGETEVAEDGQLKGTTDVIPAGETFFFLRNGDDPVKLNLAGAVKPFDASAQFVVSKEQYAFAANPFPVEMKVSDFTASYFEGTPCGNDVIGGADQIWRWVTAESKWTKYYYLSVGRKEKIERWVKDGETEVAEDGQLKGTTDTIRAGEGFFFQRNGDDPVTIKIAMPAGE